MNPFFSPGKKKMSRSGEKKRVPAFGESIVFSPLRPASARPGHGRQAGPIFFPRRGLAKGCPWACLSFRQNIPFPIGFISLFAISASTWNSLLSRIPCFPKCLSGFLVFLWRPESQHFPEYLVLPMVFKVFCDFHRGFEGRPGSRIWLDLGHPFFFPAEPGLSQARPWPPGGTRFFSPLKK